MLLKKNISPQPTHLGLAGLHSGMRMENGQGALR